MFLQVQPIADIIMTGKQTDEFFVQIFNYNTSHSYTNLLAWNLASEVLVLVLQIIVSLKSELYLCMSAGPLQRVLLLYMFCSNSKFKVQVHQIARGKMPFFNSLQFLETRQQIILLNVPLITYPLGSAVITMVMHLKCKDDSFFIQMKPLIRKGKIGFARLVIAHVIHLKTLQNF